MKATRLLSTIQHATALAAIRAAPLRHVALAPVHAAKTSPIAAVPIDTDCNLNDQLDYALDAALSFWPDCSEWSIVNSNKIDTSDSIPPDFCLMHAPEVTGSFSTFSGAR